METKVDLATIHLMDVEDVLASLEERGYVYTYGKSREAINGIWGMEHPNREKALANVNRWRSISLTDNWPYTVTIPTVNAVDGNSYVHHHSGPAMTVLPFRFPGDGSAEVMMISETRSSGEVDLKTVGGFLGGRPVYDVVTGKLLSEAGITLVNRSGLEFLRVQTPFEIINTPVLFFNLYTGYEIGDVPDGTEAIWMDINDAAAHIAGGNCNDSAAAEHIFIAHNRYLNGSLRLI